MVVLNHFPCNSVHFCTVTLGAHLETQHLFLVCIQCVACLGLNSHLFDYPPVVCFCLFFSLEVNISVNPNH